jgi:hypothetical protein
LPESTTITISPRDDYVVDSGPTTFTITRSNDLVGSRTTQHFNLLVTVNCIEKFADIDQTQSEDYDTDLSMLVYKQNSEYRFEVFSGYITDPSEENWVNSP